MRLAIVADWLTTYGGAEHVVAEFHRIWPRAPIFTTVARRGESGRGAPLGPIADADIRTTPLQYWYRLVRKHQLLVPQMPRAVEGIDLRGFDAVLSSSHAVAKGVIPPSTAAHVCYCHTPMRYAWEMEEEYLEDFRVPRLLRPHLRRCLRELRRWDLTTAKRVDAFIANSSETQNRIRDVYGRESIVIHPPADDRFFAAPLVQMRERSAFLAVGRLVPYKRFDLLVETANRLRLPLAIVGEGREEARLRRMAGPTVKFRGFVADADLPSLYARARAVLFPPHEDAGIVPLEAQACGTPVIALRKGGATDTVREGETGVFFDAQTVEALSDALERFATIPFDPEKIRSHAQGFSAERFRGAIEAAVGSCLWRVCGYRKNASENEKSALNLVID